MVKLDVTCMRHLSKHDIRVLTAVEMGMKNHDIVPVELISSIAKLRHGGSHKILSTLLTFKLIAHDRSTYDGYRLTYSGYDILALNVLQARGHIAAVGSMIGMGKEADIYMAQAPDGEQVVLKLHRLGRTSFKAVKNKRDYVKSRTSVSWLYMSRLSALKEFAFMKALHQHDFPTPTPIDHNRHAVLMTHVRGYPMYQLRSGEVQEPHMVYQQCMEIVVRLARHGLIHCDFNEFNLLVDEEGTLTLIDFPQMVSTRHANAEQMFDRDVACVVKFFSTKMKHVPEVSDVPSFKEAVGIGAKEVEHNLDVLAEASGFSAEEADVFGSFCWPEAQDEHRASTDADSDDPDHDSRRQNRCSKDSGEGAASDVCMSHSGESDSAAEQEGSDEEDRESNEAQVRPRRVKAPESVARRAHLAVQQRHRRPVMAGKGGLSRNQQKRKEKGKVHYKHRDF